MHLILMFISWLFVNSLIVPVVSADIIHPQQQRNQTHELLLALQEVSGIYIDEARRKGFEKTVMITSCNHGYINHLHNFKCFTDRLGLQFLVMSMDHIIHEYLTHNTTIKSFLMESGVVGEVSIENADFRSKQFNQITAKKKEAVHLILALGYDVLFSDSDIALIEDPVPHMILKGIDYSHSLNYWCDDQINKWDFRRSKVEGNTGFYFVRSTENTIKLWEEAYEASMRNLHLDDQAVFWTVIRHSINPEIYPIGLCGSDTVDVAVIKPNQLTTCYLDTCIFSAGMLSRFYEPEMTFETLKINLSIQNKSMCAVHANYIKGNRIKMLKMNENGLWLAIPSSVLYDDDFAEARDLVSSNSTLTDMQSGSIYNLQHMLLSHTHWRKCNEYVGKR